MRHVVTSGLQSKKVPLLLSGLILASLACERDSPTAAQGPEVDALATRAPRASVEQISNFDRGPEGWTLVGDANGAAGLQPGGPAIGYDLQPFYSSAGGHPGGTVFADDATLGMDWYWQAPPEFLGRKQAFAGGQLSFDLNAPSSHDYANVPDVIMAGGDLTLVINAGPSPNNTWTRYAVPFVSGLGWKVERMAGRDATEDEIRQVLRNLNVLRIRGEYFVGPDRGYLDNVRMRGPLRGFHRLTVHVTGFGEVHVGSAADLDCPSQCSAEFRSGSVQTLFAGAKLGAVFDHWGGDCSGVETWTCEVKMDGDRTVTATFRQVN